MLDSGAYLLLLAAISLGVVGQLLLKRGMSARPGFRLAELPLLARDYNIILGFSSYGISVMLYLTALASLDLSLAYPTVSLGYVLVILLSRLLFNEAVSRARWAAAIIICAGVILIGMGA